MYNRYIRNDRGAYTRVPQEDPPHPQETPPPPSKEPSDIPPQPAATTPPHHFTEKSSISDSLSDFLRHILDQFHLNHVDTGDLLLLGLLFFLFRENADEELLVALGLLLIL